MTPLERLRHLFYSPIQTLMKVGSPVTCSTQTSIYELCKLLATHKIGAVVVVEGVKPIGIITERDVATKIIPAQVDLATTPVVTYMTRNPVCVQNTTPLHRIMAALRLGKFRHLVVVTPSGDLVGVLSMKDVFYTLDDFVREAFEQGS